MSGAAVVSSPRRTAQAHGIEFHLGDQRSRVDCERAAAGQDIDFIVDDATHYLENTLLTHKWFWPFVKSGGVYVIEEFPGVDRVREHFPECELVVAVSPFGGMEYLVVLRKP